jgi:hypothetical protein
LAVVTTITVILTVRLATEGAAATTRSDRGQSLRQMHSGDLLSVPELAALTHLSLDAAVPGLHQARASAVVARVLGA